MRTPPILTRGKGLVGGAGRAGETKTIRRLGGLPTPASGASRAKGDMTLPDFLVECKTTIADSISIPLSWLLKIGHEARHVGKASALTITFLTGDGNPRPDGAYVIVSERVWQELLDRTKD